MYEYWRYEKMEENKDVKNGNSEDMEFQEGNFLSAKSLDRATLVISSFGKVNTRFGEKKYIADQKIKIALNATMERRLIELGYKSAKQLIGKTVHLVSVPVVVQGEIKKMWMIESIE